VKNFRNYLVISYFQNYGEKPTENNKYANFIKSTIWQHAQALLVEEAFYDGVSLSFSVWCSYIFKNKGQNNQHYIKSCK